MNIGILRKQEFKKWCLTQVSLLQNFKGILLREMSLTL